VILTLIGGVTILRAAPLWARLLRRRLLTSTFGPE
jgi:hypothetical protein